MLNKKGKKQVEDQKPGLKKARPEDPADSYKKLIELKTITRAPKGACPQDGAALKHRPIL